MLFWSRVLLTNVGFFSDNIGPRVAPEKMSSDAGRTPGQCLQACYDAGFPFAGLENGNVSDILATQGCLLIAFVFRSAVGRFPQP